MRIKGAGQLAYELRMAGVPWPAIATVLEFANKDEARHFAEKWRTRHKLPGLRASAPALPPGRGVPRRKEG